MCTIEINWCSTKCPSHAVSAERDAVYRVTLPSHFSLLLDMSIDSRRVQQSALQSAENLAISQVRNLSCICMLLVMPHVYSHVLKAMHQSTTLQQQHRHRTSAAVVSTSCADTFVCCRVVSLKAQLAILAAGSGVRSASVGQSSFVQLLVVMTH